MNKTFLLLALAMAMPLSPSVVAAPVADDESSVQIKTESLRSQMMSETITAYGAVTPITGATDNISVPRSGQIVQLMVAAGQVVKRGEPLLTLATEATTVATYGQAESTEVYARSELKRTEELATQQLATQSQVAAARKALTDAQASLAAQRHLGAGMSRQTITAPYDAVVANIAVQQGDRIQSGTSVMQLMKSGGLQVLLGVQPEEASRVRAGMTIRLVPVFGSGGAVIAKVSKVFGLINPQTRLVDVAAQLQGSSVKVLSGMQMRGAIDLGGQPSWVVPRPAVLRDGVGAYLFQVQDGHAKRIEVTTGVESNGLVAVSGHLDNKLKVVVLGNYELKGGMAVREAGE